ncbi:MAG: hypothetical protein ABIP89_17640, partial [Polyangiaceae bacterium]
RVRSRRGLAVLTACALAPVACTSLLGDYTIGSAGPTDGDASADGLASDVIGSDQLTTTDAADTGPDAAGFAKLTCTEVGGSRFVLGAFPNTGNPSPPIAFARPSNTMRVLTGDGTNVTHAYTFQTGGGGHSVTDAPLNNVPHPLAAKSYPGGIAVLSQGGIPVDGGGSVSILQVWKLADGSNTWSGPVNVTAPGEIDCANRFGATFQILDAASDDYLIVFTFSTGGGGSCPVAGDPRIFGRHFHSGAGTSFEWPMPATALPDAGSNGLDLPSQAMAVVGPDVYVMANPSGGGGPAGTPTLFKSVIDMHAATLSTFPLKSPTDFMFALTLTSGLPPGSVDLGFLEADLGSGTVQPDMYVGQAGAANLTTLVPHSGLTTTTLAGLNDIIVDKASYHWNNFGAPSNTENMLGIAPTVNTHIGLNFMWWDTQGRVRAQHTGATGNLLPGTLVYSADIAFTQPPFAVLADFELVFLKDDADAGANAIDVVATDISCIKP